MQRCVIFDILVVYFAHSVLQKKLGYLEVPPNDGHEEGSVFGFVFNLKDVFKVVRVAVT